MFSGLLMGFAALAFAACLLLVINGRAEQLLRLRFGRASSEKSVTLDKPSPTEVTAFKR